MKILILIILVSVTAISLPFTASAAVCPAGGTPEDFNGIVCILIDLVTTAIPVVAGLALVVFFWGLAKFILKAGDEKGREEGKQVMKWGIVALFVLVSIWGIIFFLTNDILGLPTPGVPRLPTGAVANLIFVS
mgnify:FL=1